MDYQKKYFKYKMMILMMKQFNSYEYGAIN